MSAALRRAMAALVRMVVAARDAVLAALFLAVAWPLWALPWPAAARLGRWYGYVAYALWPGGRRTAMINLRRAYGPTMTRARARRLTREVVGSLGQGLAEGAQFARRLRQPGWSWEQVYQPEDTALERRILEDPRPKIFVSGHLGSWEVALAIAGQRVGVRGAAIVRRVDNPFINAIFRRLRVSDPRQWIDKRGAAAAALARLRAGESVAMLVDEDAGYRGAFVDYFGRPASTSRLPAQLSLMTRAPLVLGAAVRQDAGPRFLYRLAMFEPPAEGAGSEAVVDMTARLVRQWEEWVRLTPLQWRWVHWRWRTRPHGRGESYGRRDLTACFGAGDDARLAQDARFAFDPSWARYPTRVLPLRQVIDLLDVTHAPEQVEIYRRRMAEGDRFPPVSVIVLGPWVLLADGHKRLAAYRTFASETVLVEVWPLHRWLGNQAGQLLGNVRKNAAIARLAVTDPPAAWRLAATTLAHWRRVAVSLSRRARGAA